MHAKITCFTVLCLYVARQLEARHRKPAHNVAVSSYVVVVIAALS